MKKTVLGLLLIISICGMAFSIEETWFAFGANFGNYFETGSDLGDFYFGSAGINFNGYGFSDQKNIGLFFNYGLQFPITNNIEGNYQPNPIQGDFILGLGFRFSINDNFKFHFGIGPAINICGFQEIADIIDEKKTDNRFSLGIGADAGIKYDITDIVYVNFGVGLMYNFSGYSTVTATFNNGENTKQESSGWINNYSMFGIRPYIAIGFNYYQEKGKWGKPSN